MARFGVGMPYWEDPVNGNVLRVFDPSNCQAENVQAVNPGVARLQFAGKPDWRR
jgi:hypothetical protein